MYLVERKTRLETILTDLRAERKGLLSKLENQTLDAAEIMDLQEFTKKALKGLQKLVLDRL